MKIAMLGGSFNPIHEGHMHIAEKTHDVLGYDRILFVPAYISPFKVKKLEVSNKDRCTMLKRAIRGKRFCKVEMYEMKKKGLSYTYNTVCYLEKRYKKMLQKEMEPQYQKIGLILGVDLLESFHKWYNYEALAQKVHFIIAKRRSGDDAEAEVQAQRAIAAFPFPYTLLENDYVDVSSTSVKEKIRNKEEWERSVPESVVQYIRKKNLYANE